MGRWRIGIRGDGKRAIVYENLATGQTFECGATDADDGVEPLVHWIVDEGKADPGDLITIEDRQVLQMSRGRASA